MNRQTFYYLTAFLGAILMVCGGYMTSHPEISPQQLLGIRVPVQDVTVMLDGKEVWWDSGVQVRPGDKVYITASGTVMWSKAGAVERWTSPNGEKYAPAAMPDKSGFQNIYASCGSLIGKINANSFYIGAQNTLTVNETGTLKFMVNDRIGYLKDNAGAFTIRAQVYAKEAR